MSNLVARNVSIPHYTIQITIQIHMYFEETIFETTYCNRPYVQSTGTVTQKMLGAMMNVRVKRTHIQW